MKPLFLSLQNLRARYPRADHDAVAGVSLGLEAGQIGVLIGPSGCGKTTLLRAVAGLERAAGGSIEVDGALLSGPKHHTPAEERRIGMVFQDHALFPHMNVAQNVAFGLRHGADRLHKSAADLRVHEMLALVGLPDSGGRMPHELSGGQQQRVALARALAQRPRLLLLDEPFSSLDVELRERLAQEVRGILKAAGATALMVTHDQLEAFAVGDVIGVMDQGQLHQWADAYTLYHRPTSRFVADFIGHGVFLPARVELHREDGSAHKHVVTPLGELHDMSPELLDALTPGPCDVLLRADDIVHNDHATTQAQILRKAFRGDNFLYTLRLKTGEDVLALVPSHHNHQVGEWIGIQPQVDHVVTFATV